MAMMKGNELVEGIIVQEITEIQDMFYSWISRETYDFVNYFNRPIPYPSPFVFNGLETSITDEYSTEMFAGASNNSNLTRVYMPKVTQIRTSATFRNDRNLTFVQFGTLTRDINQQQFSGCSGIVTFIVGEGTTASIDLRAATNLSMDSFRGILNAYADMTETEPAYLTVAQEIFDVFDEDEELHELADSKNIIVQN